MLYIKFYYVFIAFCSLSAFVQITITILMSKKNKQDEKLHKLYTILYEKISQKSIVYSLCMEINNNCGFTSDEVDLLFTDFKNQKPSIFQNRVFYFNRNFKGRVYWWNNFKVNESTEQRKLFVKMLVDKTNPIKSNFIDIFFRKNKKI
jgi:hypothetical protein